MWWGGGVYYNARAYPPVGDVYYNDAPQEPAYYAYRPEQPALRLAQPKFSVGIFGSTLMAEDYAGEPQNVGSLGGLYGRFRMTNNGHVWLHTELSEVSYESLGDEDTLTKFGMFAHVDLLPQSSFRLYGFVGGGIQEDFAWADSAGRLFGEAGLGIGYRFHLGPRISIDLTADIRAGKLAEEQNQNVPLSTSGTSYYEPYLPERYEAGRISLGVNF